MLPLHHIPINIVMDKNKKPLFAIFTVPHSGTRFTMEYFNKIGIKSWWPGQSVESTDKFTQRGFWQVHAGNDYLGRWTLDKYKLLHQVPVVVTVTHPHRNWVSFTRRKKSYELNVDCWEYLIKELPTLNYYLFDINCRESERKTHLINMLKFLNLHTEERGMLTDKWVNEWPFSHAQDYHQKRMYLTHNRLPSGYDYDQLQFAVDWYESLPFNDY